MGHVWRAPVSEVLAHSLRLFQSRVGQLWVVCDMRATTYSLVGAI